MANLIDREKVIEAIDDISVEVDEGYGFQYEKWRKYFCELSSADLSDYYDKLWKLAYERGKAEGQPRKGKWVDDGTEFGCCCSECGSTLDDYFDGLTEDVRLMKIPDFCLNCGADMRG